MSRSRSHEPVRLRQKDFASAADITQAIEKLRARTTQVEELQKEGLAYRDALRTTAEFQIRDTIKEIFGDQSPEYQEHQHHKIKANSKAELNGTLTMLQDLIAALEHKLHPSEPAVEPPAASAAPVDSPPVPAAPAKAPAPRTAAHPKPTSGNSHAHRKTSPEPAATQPATAPVAAARAPSPAGPESKPVAAGHRDAADTLPLIRKVCARFHPVVRQLRERSGDRPAFEVEDETDVRDLFRALLSMEFEDIAIEEWLPAYANGASRPVIVLRPEGTVIDVKKTRQGLGTKELTEQAMADFQQFPGLDCRQMFCFIYDPEGRIPNPRRLESDLTGRLEGRTTEVVVSPK